MNIGTVEVQVPFQLMQPSQINQDHPSMDNLQQLMIAQPMMHHHHHHHHVGESNQYLSLNMNLHETPAYVHHHSLQSGEDRMNASQSEAQAHTGLGSHEESSSLREEESSVHHQQHHLHQCEPHFAFNHDDGAGDSINESSQYMENAYLNQKKGQSTLSHSSKPCDAENNGNEGTETKHTEKRIRIHSKEARNDKRKRKERKRKRREKEKRNSNHNRRRRTEEVDLLLRAAENGQQHFSEGERELNNNVSFLLSLLLFHSNLLMRYGFFVVLALTYISLFSISLLFVAGNRAHSSFITVISLTDCYEQLRGCKCNAAVRRSPFCKGGLTDKTHFFFTAAATNLIAMGRGSPICCPSAALRTR